MKEQIAEVSKMPIIKNLTWMIPTGLVLFALLKVITMYKDSQIKSQQYIINKHIINDYEKKN